VTILLLGALLFPSLFWTSGPETAPSLQAAGVTSILIPTASVELWKGAPDIKTRAIDPTQLIKAATPAIYLRSGNASATTDPWLNSNGWRFMRQPDATFFYNVPGKAVALAAAEAYVYGVQAVVQTDVAGLKPFADMLALLQALPAANLPELANFEYLDDGSPASGDFMNLLIRTNLLFKTVKAAGPDSRLTVALGSPQYPIAEAANPKLLAEKVRAQITDEKRLLRIYGSSLVIGRLAGAGGRLRLSLLNYGAAKANVEGIRVRVLGDYTQHQGAAIVDYKTGSGVTEFTLTDLPVLAVIDLQR
jgi:hypothetical protein